MLIAGRGIEGIGLGTAQFAFRDGTLEDSVATVHAALDAGVMLIDTALAYTRVGIESYAEQVVARALRGLTTGRPLIATKGGHWRRGDSFPVDVRPDTLRAHCEISLRTLEADRIDLYQLHHVDPQVPLATLPGRRPRYEPRNLDFADGLDRWDLDSGPGPDPGRPRAADGEPDYAAAAEGPSAVLSSAVPRPAGSAALIQAIYADDYRGATVTFSAELRAGPLTGQAGLRLEIIRHWWRLGRAREDHGLTIAGHRPWTSYEITARIPADADLIRFGIGLTGPGRIALRNPDLRADPQAGAGPAAGTP